MAVRANGVTSSQTFPMGILTGFLGSGKTSLLRRWLDADRGRPDFAETAILINEFGDIGLDHLLVGKIDADTVLLDNGCVCCAIRGDLKAALLRLIEPGRPAIRRVILETTGLAAPGPVLATLLADRQLRHHFFPAFVCTVVDAAHAADQEGRHPEWLAQVSAADTLCISKSELVSEEQSQTLRRRLATINPLARIVRPDQLPPPWRDRRELLFVREGDRSWLGLAAAAATLSNDDERERHGANADDHHATAHSGVQSFSLVFDRPPEWFTLTLWLTMLLHRHGASILRIKGIVAIATEECPQGQPTALHGVGHVMYPPEHLEAWPNADERSRLIFITQSLDMRAIRQSWDAFEQFYEPVTA